MKIIGIYKITNPSGKVYIGQSKDIIKRWNSSYKKIMCRSQRHLYNSLKKYGPENHTFEIIKECTIDDLNELEIYYIIKYNSTNNLIGLNHRLGGNGKIFSESTKEKMRINAMGNTNMQGKTHSTITRQKISNSKKGSIHKEDTKIKMSLSKIGKTLSQETKDKISKCNKFTRQIMNTKTKISHSSIRKAANSESISESTIYRGLKTGKYEYI